MGEFLVVYAIIGEGVQFWFCFPGGSKKPVVHLTAENPGPVFLEDSLFEDEEIKKQINAGAKTGGIILIEQKDKALSELKDRVVIPEKQLPDSVEDYYKQELSGSGLNPFIDQSVKEIDFSHGVMTSEEIQAEMSERRERDAQRAQQIAQKNKPSFWVRVKNLFSRE